MRETLEFDIRPQAKERPYFARGRAITPQKTRDYEETMRWLIKGLWKRPLLTGPVKVHATFQFAHKTKTGPHCQRPDGDNLFKSFDCLNGSILLDDAIIHEGSFKKQWGPTDKIILTIEWSED